MARVAIAFFILGEDFFIYGEDPVNDSHVHANFPGMGHVMGILAVWTAPSVGEGVLKLVFILLSLIFGLFLGRLILVRVIRRRWKMLAFEGCEGAIVAVGSAVGFLLLVSSQVYNFISSEVVDGASMDLLRFVGARTLQYRHVNQCFQALSGFVDILAILMISDVILQDRRLYPTWADCLKKCWSGLNGWVRVLAFWIALLGSSSFCAAMVFMTGKEEGSIQWKESELVGATSEITRSLFAVMIIATDMFTVVQDWDFPTFTEPLDVSVPLKVAGTFSPKLECQCLERLVQCLPKVTLPSWLQDLLPTADFFKLSINGKWLTFGPLIGVMMLDLFYAKTQMMYDPVNYGEYVDLFDDSIWVIVDEAYLALAYTRGVVVNPSLITYAVRRNTTTGAPLTDSATTDVKLNSRYLGIGFFKFGALILALGAIATFLFVLFAANWRKGHEEPKQEASSLREGAYEIGHDEPPVLPQAEACMHTPEVDMACSLPGQPDDAVTPIQEFSAEETQVAKQSMCRPSATE